MRRTSPVSRRDQDLRIDVAAGLLRERVVVTVRVCDGTGKEHSLETLLTSLEARRLGHAVLDAIGRRGREWPVDIEPALEQVPHRRFQIQPSEPRADADPSDPNAVVMTLQVDQGSNTPRALPVLLTSAEATQLGHAFLGAANPSRLASEDD